MGAAERRQKDAATAAHLVKSGYPHGRRKSSPYPNSGGLTMVAAEGSSKNQRRRKER